MPAVSEEPREVPDARVARAHTAWTHRCFWMVARQKKWFVRNVFPMFSAEVPSSLVWTAFDDREGLQHYLDAVLRGQRSRALYFERNGLAIDLVYPVMDMEKAQETIHLSFKRLIEILTLRDPIDVPVWGKMRFITDGRKLVPYEFITAVAEIVDPEGESLKPSPFWRFATGKDLDRMGLKPEDVTSGMYRQVPQSTEHAPLAPSVGAQESEVRRTVGRDHVDLLTRVRPPNGTPYFVRRIFRTCQGSPVLWAGSAFEENGPWHCYHRDSAGLLAEGIVEPPTV